MSSEITVSGSSPKKRRSIPSGRRTKDSLISTVVVVVSGTVVVVAGAVVVVVEEVTVAAIVVSATEPESDLEARTVPSTMAVTTMAAVRAMSTPRCPGVRRDGREVMGIRSVGAAVGDRRGRCRAGLRCVSGAALVLVQSEHRASAVDAGGVAVDVLHRLPTPCALHGRRLPVRTR